MRRITSICLALALAFSLACSDDDTGSTADSGVGQKDGALPVGKIDCTKNTCYDYVTSKLVLPTTSEESTKYGMKFNGRTYNSLGGILALIVSQAPTLNIAEEMDGALCEGKALILMRAQAASLTNGSAIVQSWVAKDKACCTTTSDNKKCCTEAKAACFTGSTEFTADTTASGEQLFGGNISAGLLTAGPSKMKLDLTLSGGAKLGLNLVNVTISGKITKDGITEGVLSGAIPKSDLDTVVVPQIATMVNAVYIDPKSDASTKALLKSLFDANGDGKITATEVATNGLIKTFLDGDIDVDPTPVTPKSGCKTTADCTAVNNFATVCSATPAPGKCVGVKELSLGLGFTTVSAKIKIL